MTSATIARTFTRTPASKPLSVPANTGNGRSSRDEAQQQSDRCQQKHAVLAQLAERLPCKERVAGSSPCTWLQIQRPPLAGFFMFTENPQPTPHARPERGRGSQRKRAGRRDAALGGHPLWCSSVLVEHRSAAGRSAVQLRPPHQSRGSGTPSKRTSHLPLTPHPTPGTWLSTWPTGVVTLRAGETPAPNLAPSIRGSRTRQRRVNRWVLYTALQPCNRWRRYGRPCPQGLSEGPHSRGLYGADSKATAICR